MFLFFKRKKLKITSKKEDKDKRSKNNTDGYGNYGRNIRNIVISNKSRNHIYVENMIQLLEWRSNNHFKIIVVDVLDFSKCYFLIII